MTKQELIEALNAGKIVGRPNRIDPNLFLGYHLSADGHLVLCDRDGSNSESTMHNTPEDLADWEWEHNRLHLFEVVS